MHPDTNRINQIMVKVTNKGQIASCLTELSGLVKKDIQACGSVASPECQTYFKELQTCLNGCVSKVSDPSVQKELKTQISSFIATQQKGGAAGKNAQF